MTTPSLTNPNPKREDERVEKAALEQAYDAGFQASGEGWNGEYPERDWRADPTYLKNRSEALAALSAASARPSPGDPVRAALEAVVKADLQIGDGHIEAARRTLHQAMDVLSVLTPTGEGEARESLKPFVAHYQPWMDEWADDKPCTVFATVTFGDLRRARAVLSAAPTPALHEDERDLTDEDRIAYWKGAYDRMAARNIELDTRLATLCEPSNPLLAQVLEAFNGAQEDVKNHLFYNSINLFDALTRAKYAMTKHNEEATRAFADIAAERRRQTEAEGWTPHHDDEHDAGVLAAAAAAYALNAADQLNPHSQGDGGNQIPAFWPFEAAWWKPGDPRRDLVKSAALNLAEIEKIDRAAAATATEVKL